MFNYMSLHAFTGIQPARFVVGTTPTFDSHVGHVRAINSLVEAGVFLSWGRRSHDKTDKSQERELLQELHFEEESDQNYHTNKT